MHAEEIKEIVSGELRTTVLVKAQDAVVIWV